MNLSMVIQVITRHPERATPERYIVDGTSVLLTTLDGSTGHLPALQVGWQSARDLGIGLIACLHDDLTILEHGWEYRVLHEFGDPSVAVVGFGGALAIGRDDIYKTPYHYIQLARDGFMSNLRDAETHGTRFRDACDVAVLDSFSIIVRRSFLDDIGGWPVDRYPHSHMQDVWICLKAWEAGKRVRLVGVECEHTSGGRGPEYAKWVETTPWGSDEAMHRESHRLVYDEFRNILPLRVR